MSSGVEDEKRGDDVVEKVCGELVDISGKEDETPQKVTHISRSPPPFIQRLMKKNEDGKYRHFITMLKQLSINVALIEALEQMPGYTKFMKKMVNKKRSVNFKKDD